MEGFDQKTLKTSRGFKYTYYVSGSTHKTDASLPSLFFCHGWPDDAHLWEGIANHLRSLPFKLIIPDLLGYAGTDKPSDPAAYKFDGVSDDLKEIIAAEGCSKVIAVGHDWGSAIAARLYNYHPELVAGIILLNVAYIPPSKDKFDLDTFNAMTTKIFGYPIYQYWHFFTDPAAPKQLQDNAARLYAALHAEGESSMKDFFTQPNAFPDYLLSKTEPEPEVRPYAKDPAFKSYSIDRLSRDGFQGAQQYYVSMRNNVQWECDSQVPPERYVINVPLLYIGCDQDAVCRPETLQPSIDAGLIPDCERAPIIHCAHWSPYEAPAEASASIIDWLNRKYLK